MKLKLYRVNTRTVANWYNHIYIYCLGVDTKSVAERMSVPLEDVYELENEVVVNITVSDINNTHGGRNN